MLYGDCGLDGVQAGMFLDEQFDVNLISGSHFDRVSGFYHLGALDVGCDSRW